MKAHQFRANREEGQSIVILAMAMVGLLVFAGLAVDAGVIYVTSVRLARAVDAGALAGVVELPYETGTDSADDRAQQFLAANEVWPTAEITGTEFFDSAREGGEFGTVRYLITATHQADLYFLPLVGLGYVRLRDSAMAEYNPLISIYASQTGKYGIEQTVNLSIFGPRICTSYGDAYTPLTWDESGTMPNPWYGELNGVYHFRLDIPDDYESQAQSLTADQNEGTDTNEIVRIEIWDPDCYNDPFAGNQLVITNTISDTLVTISNACGSNDRREPCTPETGDVQNPYGFVRIDENRGHGTPPGDGQCGEPASYTPGYNTITEYTLYYYLQRPDGRLERHDLARYTKGGADSDSDTDMLWVCPGGSLSWDPPTDAGFIPAEDPSDGDFEIDLSTETPDIYRNPSDGSRSLFLDVRGVEGASENGFDLWAGPRYINVPSEVNARNADIILNPGEYHSSAGATWAGIGHLPMNNNTENITATITLTWVPQEYAGRRIVVESFDNDYPDLVERIDFYFNTVSKDDWKVQMTPSGGNQWTEEGGASFTVPSAPTHTFYGGFLMAEYKAKAPHDTFGWKITTDATPWLVE